MKPWFRVTYAVVQSGSSTTRSACGMNRSSLVPCVRPMEGAARAAAVVARKVRRFMDAAPLQDDNLYTHLPAESGYRPCLARRRRPTWRVAYPETSGFQVCQRRLTQTRGHQFV